MPETLPLVVVAIVATTACAPTMDASSPQDIEDAGGPYQSIPLAQQEHFAGHLGEMAVAAAFDGSRDKFVGWVHNQAEEHLCDVQIRLLLDGEPVASDTSFADLAMGAERQFELAPPTTSFARWNLEVTAVACATAHQLSSPGVPSQSAPATAIR